MGLGENAPRASVVNDGLGESAIFGLLATGLAECRAAEQIMFRHVRRVACRRRPLADGLGECADMMRAGAAANTEIVNAHAVGGGAELGDLEAIAGERVERDRKGMATGQAAAAVIGE